MHLIGRDVLVVGGGVSGLSVAVGLARHGASVCVLEKAAAISEVGAGIQVSPNGGRVLEALGLGADFEKISGASGAVRLCDASGGNVLRMDLGERGRFGLVHRADLIALLEAQARAVGVTIETDAGVRDVLLSDEGAALRMGDGSERRASLVIGADGLHSRVRVALEGERPPDFTGQVAYRALIPAPDGVPSEAQVFMGPGRHIVAYPLRNGALLNLVAVEERAHWAEEGWHHTGDADHLRATFQGFEGRAASWLASIDRCMVWGLFKHPVARRWHAPGVVMIGDAAHPTLPFLAQGACMALEDAWILVRALTGYETDSAAFAAYQAVRRPRVERIVAAATANARNYHLGGAKRVAAHTVLRMVNVVAPGVMLNRFDWLYGYDVTVEPMPY